MSSQTIFIVDDDPAVRDALAVLFELEGYRVVGFAGGAEFLSACRHDLPDCVLLDVHMPGQSGIEVLQVLSEEGFAAPVFVISGQGDIPMAVAAIKQGAYDFFEKPFDADTVVARVRAAIATARPDDGDRPDFAAASLTHLTPRERDVLGEITVGASNKEAGRRLGISPRTVEVHRARIMEKLGAKNAADLVRIVLTAGSDTN